MAESTKLRRGRAKAPTDTASNGRADDESDAQQEDAAPESGGGGATSGDSGQSTLTSELRETIREAAIEVLRPVARKATTSAAKYAVMKGPDLVKDRVGPKIAEAGGAGNLAKGVASKGGGLAGSVGGVASSVTDAASGITDKLTGKGKKSKVATGTGRGRRLPVQVYVDVAADIDTVYDQFTQFEDWPQFMHRVEKIEQRDDTTLMWHENIWGVRRSWESEITEQKPGERIAWRSKEGPKTAGVATFHRIADNLTRVYVNLDFQPQGPFEKVASGTRLARRALMSDLMRFKAFVEMRDEATGGWRGTIEDGDVVDEGEDQDSGEGEDQDRGEGDAEETEGRAEDEDAEESEEPEEEPEEEEEKPRARRRRARKEEPEEEAEEDEAEEPEAASDEDYEDEDVDEEPEEEPEPPRPARRRRRSTATAKSRS